MWHVELTTALHAIRMSKPEAVVSEETGIAPYQLRKFRAGARVPSIEQWSRLVRCVHEASPAHALDLASVVVPGELFTTLPSSPAPDGIQDEVLQASAAVGDVSRALQEGLKDQRLTRDEVEEILRRYRDLAKEVSEGLAACEQVLQGKAGVARAS